MLKLKVFYNRQDLVKFVTWKHKQGLTSENGQRRKYTIKECFGCMLSIRHQNLILKYVLYKFLPAEIMTWNCK